jgi:hypothetical protein
MSIHKRIVVLVFALINSAVTIAYAKVTPTDVFTNLVLAEQQIDVMMSQQGLKMPSQNYIEKNLKPMHVYQMVMACNDTLRELQIKEGLRPFPIMAVAPMNYTPADVSLLIEVLQQQIQRIANSKQLMLITDLQVFDKKTPTDVFNKAMDVYIKLRLLSGKKGISPDIAYAEVARAVTDAEYILINIDQYSRYQINVQKSQLNLSPTDVFKNSLAVRKTLNAARQLYQMPTTQIPLFDGKKKMPLDVFYQSQIIIAELNLIKLASHTTNITPVAISVTGKTPSDVYQLLSYVNYLMAQLETLNNIVKK